MPHTSALSRACQKMLVFGWSRCVLLFCSALTTNLKKNMEEELSFFMSALGCMSTKTLQLEGLYKMRSTAVASLKNLNKEEKQLWRLFSRLNRSWQQHGSMHQYKCSLSLQVNWYEDNSLSSHQGGGARFILIVNWLWNKLYFVTAM